MTTLAFISCGLGLALAVFFEIALNYVDKRWDTPLDKVEWLLVFWGIIFAVLICGNIIPLKSPGMEDWIPFDIVAAIHLWVGVSGGSFSRRSISPPYYPPTSIPPTPPVNPGGRDIQNSPKPKSNNNQNG
jgi:hypothetical protein